MQENYELQEEISYKRNELEEINMALSHADQRLKMDVTRQKAKQIKEEYEAAKKKRDDLQQQHTEQNMSFPEARDRLMSKVKEDTSEIQKAEKRTQELRKLIENYNKQIKEMDQEMEEKKAPNEDMQK